MNNNYINKDDHDNNNNCNKDINNSDNENINSIKAHENRCPKS